LNNIHKILILGNADVDNSISTLEKGNKYVDLFTKYNVKSLYPGEINIKGVHYYNGRVQYVSSGLGDSGPKFLQFRVFNPPTISLIELSNNQVQQ
jgi:predicted MPP superfamily phosphohydrolase